MSIYSVQKPSSLLRHGLTREMCALFTAFTTEDRLLIIRCLVGKFSFKVVSCESKSFVIC